MKRAPGPQPYSVITELKRVLHIPWICIYPEINNENRQRRTGLSKMRCASSAMRTCKTAASPKRPLAILLRLVVPVFKFPLRHAIYGRSCQALLLNGVRDSHDFLYRFLTSFAVRQYSGQVCDFRDPPPVVFQFRLNRKHFWAHLYQFPEVL